MLDKSNHASRLGITEAELQALLDVRDDLASGKIGASDFDMRKTFCIGHCRTVGCIGGYLGARLGVHATSYPRDAPEVLHSLFWPDPDGFRGLGRRRNAGWQATPSQAVAAIDRWIATEGAEAW